jgi:small subunit ribosomal protein S3e
MADNKVRKINTKKKFVADGVFQAELNEFLQKTLGMEGYAGIEIRATSVNTEIRVRAAKAQDLIAKQTRKVKEIKSLIEKRYNFNDSDNKVDLAIKPVPYDRNLCAAANVETLKYKLLTGTPVRMAANNILGTVMRRGGAIGCEVNVAGKVRGQRAKAQKYTQGYQVSTGQPKYDFIDIAVRSVELRQGVLGLKVKIMQGTKIRLPNGKDKVMPDFIEIAEPKDDRDEAKDPYVIAQKRDDQQETPAQQ